MRAACDPTLKHSHFPYCWDLFSQRDKSLLLSALQTAAALPTDIKLADQVGKARSALNAAELVLGPLTRAGTPERATVPNTTEADLRNLFDTEALKANLAMLQATGQPAGVGRDGAGLELCALKVVRGFGATVPAAVQHMRLTDVSRMSADVFRQCVALAGSGSAVEQQVADAVLAAAKEAAGKLASMPRDWRLTASNGT